MKRYKAIADYYDAETAGMRMLKHDVPFFLGQLPKRRQSILELAVGTGRAAIPIAESGHRVVGVDYDPELLEIARRKQRVAGLDERDLTFRLCDVLKLQLKERFDWICIFFNTFLAFTTIEEQSKLLQIVHRHLKPRGRFYVDIFQPNLAMLTAPSVRAVDPRVFHVPQLNRTVFFNTDIRRNQATQVQEVTFNYFWFDEFGEEHRRRIEFDMTWIFPRELRHLMERNGFVVEELWGNYDGSALASESPRIIARCMKR